MDMSSGRASLERLLRFGHHEAIAVTVGENGRPHAAAMGVRLMGGDIVIRPHLNTRTLRNIRAGSAVSLAFTHNALIFCDVVLRPSRLKFRLGRSGTVYVLDADVDLYVEAVPKSIELGDRAASVLLRVVDVYGGSPDYFPYSRANSMLIEALVYFTKLRALGSAASPPDSEARDWLRALEYSLSIVERLGSEELVECAKDIRGKLGEVCVPR